jgi:hypothetical protein
MPDLNKVIKGLECCANEISCIEKCPYNELGDSWHDCVPHLAADALALLKAQKQEINRLKHHIDCDAAEKLPSGCVGYGRGFNDDEPCETCKACEKYNGYGEE